MPDDPHLLGLAISLARDNLAQGGRPFGALVSRDGTVVATGVNDMIRTGDPTAHAELSAIRAASRALGTARLDGCEIYASGHPCPMCLAAMYLTGITAVTYAYSNEDGEGYGLSTARIYAELRRPPGERSLRMSYVPLRSDGEHLYETWRNANPPG